MTTLTLTLARERARYGKRASTVPSRFYYEAQGEAMPIGWTGVEAEAEAEAEKGRGRRKTGAARKAKGQPRPGRRGRGRAR